MNDEIVTNQSLDARLREVELKIDARIKEAELKNEVKLAETKSDLIRWVISVGLLQTALITALLLKLISSLPN